METILTRHALAALLAATGVVCAQAATIQIEDVDFWQGNGGAFGSTVAVDGNTAVVGAPSQETFWQKRGTANIYERAGNGEWSEVATFESVYSKSAALGRSVAIQGGFVVAGAPLERYGGWQDGKATLYSTWSQGTWRSQKSFQQYPHEYYSEFGAAVAMSEDVIAVGAPGRDSYRYNDWQRGSAYVYDKTRENWVSVWRSELLPIDYKHTERFGAAVDVDQTVAIASDPEHDSGYGAVYVFTRRGEGDWDQIAQFFGAERRHQSMFGLDVKIAGDVALVSAPEEDGTGRVYVYQENDAGEWAPAGTLAAEGLEEGAEFGASIDLIDGEALVSAPGVRKAYRFELASDRSWRQVDVFEGLQMRDVTDVSLDGRTALFGVPRQNRVYAYAYGVPEPGSSLGLLVAGMLLGARGKSGPLCCRPRRSIGV